LIAYEDNQYNYKEKDISIVDIEMYLA